MFRRLSEFGMLLVLLALGTGLSIATWGRHDLAGAAAAAEVCGRLKTSIDPQNAILIAAGTAPADQEFAANLEQRLQDAGFGFVTTVVGEPRDLRQALESVARLQRPLGAVAASSTAGRWLVLTNIATNFPVLGNPEVITPRPYVWPTFLMADNLLNITNQISVTAILAIGMTLVILTGGIDLSVGSLLALSAVISCLLIERWGALQATPVAMAAAVALAMAATGLAGWLNGLVITQFKVPPFIVTLAMMLIASGTAFLLTGGESASRIPASFSKLGVGTALGRIPNSALLAVVLYAFAHLLLSKTVAGRYLYAVGGNPVAARLSGVRVNRVLITSYTLCGLLAGLGGVVMASQLNGGSPKYGQGYELYVIAAVVVGGTSLSGGEGTVIGTLIGALIISVIRNGMNLLSLRDYTQQVTMGGVILVAVLIDNLKRRSR